MDTYCVPQSKWKALIATPDIWSNFLIKRKSTFFKRLNICLWLYGHDYIDPYNHGQILQGLPWSLSGRESACQCRKIPWRRKPTPIATHSSTLAWKNPMDRGAWWAVVYGVMKSWTQLSNFTFTFHFHALEKEMATHSSVLAWRIPGTEEPDGLLSMRSHRVGHNWSNLAAAATTTMV